MIRKIILGPRLIGVLLNTYPSPYMIKSPYYLQTPCTRGCLINTVKILFIHLISSFSSKSSKHLHPQSILARDLNFWEAIQCSPPSMGHMSHVTGHVSYLTFHVSHITCHDCFYWRLWIGNKFLFTLSWMAKENQFYSRVIQHQLKEIHGLYHSFLFYHNLQI